MSTIPAKAIVNVTPNVLAAGGDALDLNGLVLTTNTRVPIGTVQSFPSADAVSNFFGASAPEVTVAEKYFLGFTNSNTKPAAILFAQYPQSAVAAYLRGGNAGAALTLAELQALTPGTIGLTVDGNAWTSGSIDLSGATSFSDAAGTIETAFNSNKPTSASSSAASISGTTLTVGGSITGVFRVGQILSGSGVTAGTRIISQLSGTAGGAGTYQVSASQTVGSEAITAEPRDISVDYDSVSGAFVVTSGNTGAASTMAFATGALAISLLLTSATGAVTSQGAAVAVPATFMNALIAIATNWATFMTQFDPDGGSGNTVKLAFAAWTSAQNGRYGYVCWDTDVTPSASAPAAGSLGALIAAASYGGTFLIGRDANGTVDQTYAAFVCGIGASIDFTQLDGRTTYAFRQQAGLVATVTDETAAANLLANGYSFYGAYATANDEFVWLYNGQVSGPFLWMDSFVDQIWMTNNFQLSLMVLLQQQKSVAYNAAGYAKLEAALADPINAALNFGAIRSGVPLSASQTEAVNVAAGKDVASILQTRGWYLLVLPATAEVRAARASPPMTFWYTDGQSVQQIDLTSVAVL